MDASSDDLIRSSMLSAAIYDVLSSAQLAMFVLLMIKTSQKDIEQ